MKITRLTNLLIVLSIISAILIFDYAFAADDDLPYQGQVGPLIDVPDGIPDWIKFIFIMWANDHVTDEELINAIIYLMQVGIIVL